MGNEIMVTIVDTGIECWDAIESAMKKIVDNVVVTADKERLSQSQCIILYSTASFTETMHGLYRKDLIHFLKGEAFSGTFFVGIGMGMHLLFTNSEEQMVYEGLNLLPGKCRKLPHKVEGWDELYFKNPHPLFRGMKEDAVYFSHSSYVEPTNQEDILAVDSQDVSVIVGRRNIYGLQFFPEKCGVWGEDLLRQFVYANDMKV